jgi:hypothetical protein
VEGAEESGRFRNLSATDRESARVVFFVSFFFSSREKRTRKRRRTVAVVAGAIFSRFHSRQMARESVWEEADEL